MKNIFDNLFDRLLLFSMIYNAAWMIEFNNEQFKTLAAIFLSLSGLIFILRSGE